MFDLIIFLISLTFKLRFKMNWPDICMSCAAGRWDSAEAETVYA